MSPTSGTGTVTVVHGKTGQTVGEYPLRQGASIGRRAGNDLQLEDLEVSRSQARLVEEEGIWYLHDVGSRNGTDLDGRRIAPHERAPLRDGSSARIGPFVLQFRLSGAGEPTAPLPARPARGTPPAAPNAPAWTPEPEPPPPPSPLMSHLLDPRSRIPVWSEGEVTLKVADIIEETADAKTFRLVGETPLLFSFKPGQFVTLNLEIDGQKVRRSYSISSSPSRPHALEITVKRVPGGLVSNYLNDHVRLGQPIQVRGPAGKFSCFDYPSRKILAIAAGSGITPVMSMARWIVDTAADVDFTLLYSARSPQDMIFRRELEYMSSRHSGFRVLVTVTSRWHGVDAWTGCTGRIDERLLRLATPDLEQRHAFLCGPAPFMEAVKETLKNIDFPLPHLHSESFGAGRVVKEAPPARGAQPERIEVAARETPPPAPVSADRTDGDPSPPAEGSGTLEIVFAASGKRIRTNGETPLLDLAEQCGVEIEYGCRSGSCGSCRVRCSPADVELPAECALAEDERSQGWVLACVGHPRANLEVSA